MKQEPCRASSADARPLSAAADFPLEPVPPMRTPDPTWERRWRDLILGDGTGPTVAVQRTALWALSQLYGGVIGVYRAAYDSGLLRTVTAACKVVSVGNLTVGGTGKSTTVRWLARWLRDRGVRVAVLSYGYRAGSEEAVTVVSDGRHLLVPERVSGDEPRMLAEALPGVPVLIGKRRQLSAAEAVRRFGAQVCVLDDAFQYWRLRKDLEIVLIDAACPFGGGHLLPRGLLRESPRQLRRADVLIVTNSHRVSPAAKSELRRRLSGLNSTALLAEARHVPQPIRSFGTPTEDGPTPTPPASLSGARVLALSTLGNPEGFERCLAELGATVVPARYPDHYHYHQEELRREVERARALGCSAIVTTEKDAVKLDPAWMDRFPICVLPVELAFDAGQTELEARLEALVTSG